MIWRWVPVACVVAGCAHHDLHDRTIGVFGVRGRMLYALDLSLHQPPTAYSVACQSGDACPPFEPGRTYRAHVSTTGPDASMRWVQYQGAHVEVLGYTYGCTDANEHWHYDASAPTDESPLSCVAGAPEAVDWQPDRMAATTGSASVPPCADQGPLAGQAMTVVIRMSAAPGMSWTYDEAPAMLADELLTALDAHGLDLSEANGVEPNLYLDVTLDQEAEGTEQDTAAVDVSGLGRGALFHETSGAAPFTSAFDALDALAARTAAWLTNGWTATGPCRQSDGSVRVAR